MWFAPHEEKHQRGELIQENSFEVLGDDRGESNSLIVVNVTEVSLS